jgi:hypothetical protein
MQFCSSAVRISRQGLPVGRKKVMQSCSLAVGDYLRCSAKGIPSGDIGRSVFEIILPQKIPNIELRMSNSEDLLTA